MNRRPMVRYLKDLETLAPLGYTVGVQIRFAAPLFMRSTYPAAWQALYTENNYALRDPLVFWGISSTGTVRWSEISLPDPFGVLDQAAAHGLTFGAVASCGKITSRTIVGVARDDREFTDGEMAGVATIADALHELTVPPGDLTPAMIEVLRLAETGRRHAAEKLGITESAFDQRLSSTRERLGAQTTAEALRMARDFRLM